MGFFAANLLVCYVIIYSASQSALHCKQQQNEFSAGMGLLNYLSMAYNKDCHLPFRACLFLWYARRHADLPAAGIHYTERKQMKANTQTVRKEKSKLPLMLQLGYSLVNFLKKREHIETDNTVQK